MGCVKTLLPGRRGTVLADAVWPHLEAGVPRVVVVVGPQARAAEAAVPADPRVTVVENRDWRTGLASSLRRGLDACADAEAVLLALGDQPDMTAGRIEAVRAAYSPGVLLVVPSGQAPSHPVLFARALFAELRAVKGDRGGREVVARHRGQAVEVALPPLPDLDTPEDYWRWRGAGDGALPKG